MQTINMQCYNSFLGTSWKVFNSKNLALLLLVILAVSVGLIRAKSASCSRHTCKAPDCRCPAHSIPGGLRAENVPQMVLLAFDDAVNWDNWDYYLRLFPPDGSRKNPNGCPASASFFVSHNFTDYCMVGKLQARGMEIGVHSVTHRLPRKWWTDADKRLMEEEVLNQRRNLIEKAEISMDYIKGWRSPFLQPAGDELFTVLHENNFTYDSTLTYSFPKNLYSPVLWPFTLDFGYTLVCNIERCPHKFYPALWEIPVVGVMDYREHRLCAYVDDCFNMPRDKTDAYQMLWKNFLRNYRSNRAPLYLNLHSPWLNTPYQLDAMDEFIQKMVSMEDVYLVTFSQALAWQRHPTPLDQIADFAPWQCPNARPHAEDDKRCSFTFRHKTASGHGHGTGIEGRHGGHQASHRVLGGGGAPKARPASHNISPGASRSSSTSGYNTLSDELSLDTSDGTGDAKSHIVHQHDHRTHRPWFLRGSATTARSIPISWLAIYVLTSGYLLHTFT